MMLKNLGAVMNRSIKNAGKGVDRALGAYRFERFIGVFSILFLQLLPVLLVFSQAPVDTNETWTSAGTGGWYGYQPQSTLSNPGGCLNMQFAEQFQPMCVSDIAQRNLSGSVVTNISFRFVALNSLPSAVRLYFHSSLNGHFWYVNLTPPPVTGDWVAYDVPVNSAVRWIMGPDGNVEQFNSDIEWIDWVGVYVRRNGDVGAQNYAIDDFHVLGFKLQDTDGDGLPDVWELANNLNPNNPGDAVIDSDGDGMNNRWELRAGTDPDDSDSSLKMGINTTNSADMTFGMVLKWTSVPYRLYTIERATDLMQGFSVIASDIIGIPPENLYKDVTATNAGPYFYRIKLQ